MWKVIKVLQNHGAILEKAAPGKPRRACPQGHFYVKSTDCPTCPICESAIPMPGDLPKLAAPARRALERQGIHNLQQLSLYAESEIQALHGLGNKAVKTLQGAMQEKGLQFATYTTT